MAVEVVAKLPTDASLGTTTETNIQAPSSIAEERNSLIPPSASPASTEKAGKGKPFRALRDRIALRRSFSTKHSSLSSPSLVSPPLDRLVEGKENNTGPVASPKRVKPNALERLLGGKMGGKKTKDGVATAEDTSIPVALDTNDGPSSSSESSQPDDEENLPAIPEVEIVAPEQAAPTQAPQTNDPEPLPVARRIQSLLSALPPFLSTCGPPANPESGDTSKKDGDTESPGTVPDEPEALPDSRLLSLLSSPAVMNGSLGRGRKSVWAMLDNLRVKALKSKVESQTGTPPANDAAPTESILEDDDSIMFYGPLIPDAASSVELARSEIVSVDENGTVVDIVLDDAPLPGASTPRPSTPSTQTEAFKWHWPFHRDTPPAPPPKPKNVVKRVWVPSTTKLSLQVMWWGYRLWLPPPVLALLNDKQMEAAKVGAMITAALQWLLNNVPESALPPTIRPALELVRSLVPYLGYIGGFVAWSWNAIKGFDEGNGVTLTATWLLPIALIPGTWEDADVPKPPATDPSAPTPTNPPTPGTSNPPPPAVPSTPSTGNPPPSTSNPQVNSPTVEPLPPSSPSMVGAK